ncbi:hypothetical protein [Odoribacter sp. Z80]|uniref:hypothetical protein n=1 Tax=Odoribacter sp. Z80 TaxID=2304575 RepID=UPI00137964B9|nr:hypothetical protein [Odoribacter sp. Z80]NCE71598.1 hypothetical protein [Odoribacter sp. Z80]
MDGDVSESNFTRLNDYWNIEEQAMTALAQWEMRHITLNTTLNTLSGEEKRKMLYDSICWSESFLPQ